MQLRAEDRGSVTDLQNLLRSTAEVYTNLVQHAKAASVPIPPEAQLGAGVNRGPEELQYDEFAAASAADWDDFQDEGETTGLVCLSLHYFSQTGWKFFILVMGSPGVAGLLQMSCFLGTLLRLLWTMPVKGSCWSVHCQMTFFVCAHLSIDPILGYRQLDGLK